MFVVIQKEKWEKDWEKRREKIERKVLCQIFKADTLLPENLETLLTTLSALMNCFILSVVKHFYESLGALVALAPRGLRVRSCLINISWGKNTRNDDAAFRVYVLFYYIKCSRSKGSKGPLLICPNNQTCIFSCTGNFLHFGFLPCLKYTKSLRLSFCVNTFLLICPDGQIKHVRFIYLCCHNFTWPSVFNPPSVKVVLEVELNSADYNYNRYGSVLNDWFGKHASAPLAIVYVTLGTIFNSKSVQEWKSANTWAVNKCWWE